MSALVLASCSTNSKASTRTTSGHGTTTTNATPSTTATTSALPASTTIASTTTTTAAPAPTTTSTLPTNYCQVSDLHASVEGTQGAAGTIEVTFRLTNVSPSTCVMWGYPGALLLGHGGAPLPTVVKRGGSLSFLNISVTTTSVVAGGSAYFNMGYTDVPGGGPSCSNSSSLEITPPNDTEQLVVPVAIEACDGGQLAVSPVFGSSSPATSTTAPPT